MKTLEGKLKDQVKAFLKERGAWFFMPVPTGYGTPTLDFIGCYKGRFVAIETKAPGKKPTPRQMATLQAMGKAGAVAFWTDDIERCKRAFDLI
jgi:hypothetical protein